MKLIPYIMFSGDAEQALNFYKEVLNGEIKDINRFGEAPMNNTPEGHKDKILHSTFLFGGNTIMVSDSMPGQEAASDSNIHLSIDMPDADELQQVFTKLSVGGEITMPLQDTFWGATFGMLTDKFNVKWMFNHDKKKE